MPNISQVSLLSGLLAIASIVGVQGCVVDEGEPSVTDVARAYCASTEEEGGGSGEIPCGACSSPPADESGDGDDTGDGGTGDPNEKMSTQFADDRYRTITGNGPWLQEWRDRNGVMGGAISVIVANSPFTCPLSGDELKKIAQASYDRDCEQMFKNLDKNLNLPKGYVCRNYAACTQEVLSRMDPKVDIGSINVSYPWFGAGHAWNEVACGGKNYALDMFNGIIIVDVPAQ